MNKEEIAEKKRLTWQKNYGVDNIFQDKDFLAKQLIRNQENRINRIKERHLIECQYCKFTAISLYGLSKHIKRKHNISDKEYYDKYFKKENEGKCKICGKETSFHGMTIKYSLYCSRKCAWMDPSTEEKRQSTCTNKYGESHPQKTKEQRQRQKTWWDNNPQFKKETSDFWKEKWKDEEYKIKLSNLFLDKWNNTERRKQARTTAVERIETQQLNGEPLCPCIGFKERPCLNYLEQLIPYKIIRCDHNIFDLVAFFPDGHIPELKLFIEYDEKHHFEDKKEMTILKQKDIDRQLVLESIPGYRVFRISEKDWTNNKEQVINQFKQLIEEFECQKKN